MSTVMKEVVKMCCKAVVDHFFKVLGLLVEPSKAISKPHGYLEAYTYIR